MSKRKQLYNLRLGISVKARRVEVLTKTMLYEITDELERNVLAEIALDEINKIYQMSAKIGKILKH